MGTNYYYKNLIRKQKTWVAVQVTTRQSCRSGKMGEIPMYPGTRSSWIASIWRQHRIRGGHQSSGTQSPLHFQNSRQRVCRDRSVRYVPHSERKGEGKCVPAV